MLGYNDMIKCGQKYAFEKKRMLVERYKAFIKYLKNVVMITFGDNEEQIVSYLKETMDKSLLLNWNVIGIHSDGFFISTLGKTIDVESLRAHDSHYDPILNLNDVKDDDILTFFDHEYKHILGIFSPRYYLQDCEDEQQQHPIEKESSVIWQIANKLNEAIFREFAGCLSNLGIDDIRSFKNSKYALNFTDERRNELDKELYELYDSYTEEVYRMAMDFDEYVKDLK
jgi:hypothetical protein